MYEKLFALQEDIFKVIANQKRLEIIQLLSSGERTVTEMTDMLGIRQANLSQHLAPLRQAKILETRREGVQVFYHLTDERIADAVVLIRAFLQEQHKIDPEVQEVIDDQSNLYPVVRDVVCGMRISVAKAGGRSKYEKHTYYFCASGCKKQFDAQPNKYAVKEAVHG